jgi:hypothetical protein
MLSLLVHFSLCKPSIILVIILVQEAKHLKGALEGKMDLQFQLNRVQEEAAGLTAQLEEAWNAMGRVSTICFVLLC